MGKQYNKIQKRRRQVSYLKRKTAAARQAKTQKKAA
jgi:ribosomal protein S15P/S13E